MSIVDTHTHLYLPEFEGGGTEAVDRALAAGVDLMIFPNVGLDTVEPMKELHRQRPECTRMAMGLHPTEVGEDWAEALARIDEEWAAEAGAYVGVGEIGIDLYWDKTFAREQMEVFDRQCARAVAAGLPVIIHCREGLDATLEVLEGHHGITGVMHSFSGTPAEVDRVRSRADLYFGINGIATFKNARLDDTIREITDERLLLETDSPYLAPVPHRGKRNESAYIVNTADKCASVLGMAPERLAAVTSASARTLFKLA